MALQSDITSADGWFCGTDIVLRVRIYQSGVTMDDILNGSTAYQDITDWSLSFMLKKASTDLDALAKIVKDNTSSPAGLQILDAVNGLIEIAIDDVDTDDVNSGIYRFEVKRTDEGAESVLSYGSSVLRKAVHRT